MEESVQEYQAILDHAEEVANLGSWKWDLRTNKVTWSNGMFRLFGVEYEGFDGDPDRIIAARVHPDDIPAVRESNRSVLEDGVPPALSYRIVLPDGKERTVWAQGKLLYNENDQPVCLTGYIQDITERVRAENRIIQLKRMYATLSQVNQMIVHVREREELFRTICDVTAKYGEFSLSWIGLVNEASGEVRPVAAHGLDVKNWPHPIINAKQGPYQNRLMTEAISTSQVVTTGDIRIDERNGNLHGYIQGFPTHSVAVVPFRLRGRPIGVLVLISDQGGLFKENEEISLLEEMALDISFALDNIENENERQQAEMALQESENRYRDLVETSQDGIFINRQGQIVFINRRGLEMLGAIGYGQILGRSPFEIFHPDVHPIMRERIKQILTNHTAVPPLEEKILTLDGRTVPVEVTAAEVQVNGAPSIQVILRDITERKQAEARLRQSEERYRLISENTADVIWVLDPLAGRFKYISPSVERLRGYTPAEIMERPVSEALTPDSFALISKLLAEHLPPFMANGLNPQSFVTEVDQPCKDGSIVHTEVTTTMVFNQQGEVEVIGVSRNITERKQAEQALRENEERLRLSLQAANQGLYDLNVQTGDAIVNREYAQMLGYDPETFVETNTRWIERLHPDDTESVSKAYEDYINGLRPDYRIEFRQKTRDGNWKWILSLGRVIEYDGQQRPLRMMGTHTDITERKQAEDALKQNEHVLRLFVEHSPASIAMFDQDMRYIVASRRYLVDYRLDEQDLTGRSHYELFPEMPERWKEIHRRCLQGAIEKAEDDPFPREDGRLDWVRWEIHPWYEESGKVGGLILFSEVITERKQVQDDLRLLNLSLEQRVMERTMELSQANRAKDEFLANMSHELRTPLNAILGLSESLLEQRRGHLNARQIQSVELIASSGKHLLNLINDILEVSKIEAGKLQLHTDIVSIKELCESSLNFIREPALQKLITVEFTNEESISTFQADPQRVKQILINLLTNAVKFTPQRGRVSLDVRTNPGKDQILFSITDTGIGIAPDDLKKLFTPFTQLDSSLARQYAGTGLGLSLVRKLTELHGGSVEVDSELGKGSRFTVALPHNPASYQDPSGEGAASRPGGGIDPAAWGNISRKDCIVLLAEDNRVNSEMLLTYLEGYGYTVLVAQNGEEVLQKVEEIKPDVIIMDIQMPKMDGLETTHHLRMDPRFHDTPIIALTALVMPGDKERCLEAGVNEYLSKPVNLKTILSVVEKFTEEKS